VTQITPASVVSPPSIKKKDSGLSNIRRDSVESRGEYDADEFEKEDLVQMREPKKTTMRKGRNLGAIVDK